jgi:hypothetical protein
VAAEREYSAKANCASVNMQAPSLSPAALRTFLERFDGKVRQRLNPSCCVRFADTSYSPKRHVPKRARLLVSESDGRSICSGQSIRRWFSRVARRHPLRLKCFKVASSFMRPLLRYQKLKFVRFTPYFGDAAIPDV